MTYRTTRGDESDHSRNRATLARRAVIRGTVGVIAGGVGVSALTARSAAQDPIEEPTIDVRSTINLHSRGVIPVEVNGGRVAEGDSPCLLPVGEHVVAGPRFGPLRVFQEQGQLNVPLALQLGQGAAPAHNGGHSRGNTTVGLHFRTQDAGFEPTDVENGTVIAMLAWIVEKDGQNQVFSPTDQVKGDAPCL